MFDFGINSKPVYKITKPVRLIETFSGVGTQSMALRDLGVDYESYRSFEIDKAAVASYNAIHGTSYRTADIRAVKGADLGIVDKDRYEYILTYSFPCTDLSNAGKRQGMTKSGNTRSGLLWELERILNETDELPQVLVMENVTQVHNSKNIDDFNLWLDFLKSKGYSNHYGDLNAKDFNIPQSRARCFMVSILGDYDFVFPEPVGLTTSLKDVLDNNVPNDYDLSRELYEQLVTNLKNRGELTDTELIVTPSYSISLDSKERQFIIGAQRGRDIYDPHYRGKKENRTYQQRLEINNYGISNTLTTVGKDNNVVEIQSGEFRIRKMTPRECWRLMGFSDEDFDKAASVTVPTQLCKQAGNAIVKQVLMALFGKLF